MAFRKRFVVLVILAGCGTSRAVEATPSVSVSVATDNPASSVIDRKLSPATIAIFSITADKPIKVTKIYGSFKGLHSNEHLLGSVSFFFNSNGCTWSPSGGNFVTATSFIAKPGRAVSFRVLITPPTFTVGETIGVNIGGVGIEINGEETMVALPHGVEANFMTIGQSH